MCEVLLRSPQLSPQPSSAAMVQGFTEYLSCGERATRRDKSSLQETAMKNPEPRVLEPSLKCKVKPSSNSRGLLSKFVGQFELKSTLGIGAFGRVVLAKNLTSGEFYAVKVIKKEQLCTRRKKKMIVNEKVTMEQLDCTFVVSLLFTLQDQNNLYLVLEYCCCGDLFTYLAKSGSLPEPVCCFIAAQLVLAIDYLHSQNIAHRDVKTENILIDQKGYIKLADFGFAIRLPIDKARTYSRCGTMNYLAPEVLRGNGYGTSVDWWALGVVIYATLSLQFPFAAETQQKTYENIMSGAVNFPHHFSGSLQRLLHGFLNSNEIQRLGCSGNVQDVQRHSWFQCTNWGALEIRKVPSPLVLDLPTHPSDTRNFAEFADDSQLFGQFDPTECRCCSLFDEF